MAKKATDGQEELLVARAENAKILSDLIAARIELTLLKEEKRKRAEELGVANIELAFQDNEKGKRAVELGIANKELVFQDSEKLKREVELSVANIELAYQNDEKIKRADELIIANKELTFQNRERENRAAELILANKELVYQNEEKEKRAQELIEAYQKLVFQNEERDKRTAELGVANIELAFQNNEKEKLELTSQYARSLIEASLDPFVTISAEGKITDVNEASIKVTGFEREKLINTDFSNYFTEPNKAQEGYRQVFEKGFVADYPLTIKHKNGNLTDVLYNASVYKDVNGKVLGVFAAARDITEQKKVENVLKESEEKFKLIFEKSTAPIIVADDKGNYLEVNKAVADVFEYSINELMGMNVVDLITTRNSNAAAQYEEYIKKGEEIGEFGFTSKKGTPKIVQYQAVRIKPDYNLSVLMDVTEQKQASQYARSLIEASLDPLVTISADGKITDVNEASIEATGVAREKLIGTDFSSYFTEPTKAQEGYLRVFEQGFVSDYPLTLRHVNGARMDVLYNASLYKDKAGVVLGVFAAARDVTKQKLADANLKKSLQEISGYKFALEESSNVSIADAQGTINFVNDNFCKLSKYSREELVGQDHRIVNSGYHTKEFIKELWDKILNGEIWRGEIRNKAKDGSLYWVDSTIVPFADEHGEIYQFVSIRTDITSKKLVSQYVRSLIEASNDPLLVINNFGKITDMNEATVVVTGKPREKLAGSDFKNYFTEPTKASNVYLEIFAKGFVVDYPLTITDHKLTDVLFNGSVYKDEKGNVQGAVIVARDITIQKRNEKELTEAKVFAELATSLAEEAKNKAELAALVAEEAVKSKQQFLSNMSHEIRTPMNAIIGFTKVLLKTEFTAKQKEYLMAIKMSGDALIVLINDILDLAKVDAGKMSFESIPFRMASSITAMLHLFEPKIHEKNLELARVYDDAIPEVLMGDPVRLHQIILNLVSNAVKFTSKGKITISVKIVSEDEEKVTLEFAISDTGIGIAENKMEKIFENFQQASSGTSRLYGGTGLGLAICKQLVESQGGTISVTSVLEQGSSFIFRLEFKKTTANPEFEVIQEAMDDETRNIKVLVVEDVPLNQLLMKTLLDDFGFERDIAGNGKIALEKLEAKTYDIILMDLQMPEMNGFEATDYIRNVMNSKIPIIALTADVTTVDLAKCKAVGMNDYIAKPVDEKSLYNKIVGLVKKPSSIKFNKGQEAEPGEKIKTINLAYLTHRTKSNPKLMMEMISAYLDQTPALIISMNQSFRDKDWKLLNASVHKMIPSFSIMGMSVDFERMAKKIQEYATTQQLSEGITEMVLQLGEVCTQACKELEVEFNAIKNTHNDKG